MMEAENVIPGDGKKKQKIMCFKCPSCDTIFTMMVPAKEYFSISAPCPVCKVSRKWFDSRYPITEGGYRISKFRYKWLRFFRALKPEKEE